MMMKTTMMTMGTATAVKPTQNKSKKQIKVLVMVQPILTVDSNQFEA